MTYIWDMFSYSYMIDLNIGTPFQKQLLKLDMESHYLTVVDSNSKNGLYN